MLTLDTIVVALIVAFALGFVGRRVWRTIARARGKSAAACANCGCGTEERDPLSV